jgi:signal transduction histidine kinase
VTTLLDVVATVAGDVDRDTALRTLVSAAVSETSASAAVLELLDSSDQVVETVVARESAAPPGTPTDDRRVTIELAVGRHGQRCGRLRLETTTTLWSEEQRDVAETLADAIALVLDIARTRHLVERRRVWLEATSALLDHAAHPFDLHRVLAEVTTRTAVVTGAVGVAVLQLRDDGKQAVVLAARGLEDPAVGDAVEAAARHVGRYGVPLEDLEVPGSLVTVVVPLRSLVAAPGVLVLVHRDSTTARDVEERALLGGFADQAGLALDRAQAVVDRRDLEVAQSRDRESRDVHDVALQRLFATGMHLQAVRMAADDETGARLDQAVEALDATIRELRRSLVEREPERAYV